MNAVIETAKYLIYETTRFVSPTPVAIEWVIAIFAALLVAITSATPRWQRLRGRFHSLANRKRLSVALCALLPVAIRLSLLGVMPVPEPSIHDEFSHLLLADTLVHHRLANPVHPMWQHFESIHIIQQPSYASMYPPAQGIALALGQALFHLPWAGVVVAVGVMCGAICWMMQGWLPASWALYGSLIVALKIGIVGLWMNSYLGAAVPAIGGALLIGALPRLRSGSRTLHASIAFGLGMLILMNSRPFDGALLSVAALLFAIPAMWRGHRIRALIPAAIVLTAGILWTGYYNWRVTGHATRMGYQVNRQTYGWPENLAFLRAKKLSLRDPVLEKMYLKEIKRREVYRDPVKLLDDLITRVFDSWTYFIGPLLTVPLLFAAAIWRDRRTRPLLIFIAIIAALNLFQLVLYPYHLAPLVAVIFTLVAAGLHHLYTRIGPARGGAMLALLPICIVAIDTVKQTAPALNLQLAYWERAAEFHRDARAEIAEWLQSRARKQLVVVRYSPSHEVNQEWVYNGADIDGGKIVWAREVNPASDAALLNYFGDREAWLLEADVLPQRVVAYPR